MPFHIKKAFVLDNSKTVYYTGGSHWSEDYSKRKSYVNQSEADALLVTGDDKQKAQFKNSTVSSDT